ncbi:hypothetical protein ACFWXA_13230 [Streptomyces atroolivaceus]|uniref:hypothetical protein n=1 Tax=Streptomyces atroolivaceus TaxID=66869 RepID=UPI0036527782
MGAHLHAVPDPEPDEAPAPGDWPVPVVVAPRVPAHDEIPVDARELEDAPADEEEQDPDDDQDQIAADEPEGEEDEEEPHGLLSGLKPYYDVRQLPVSELGALAVEVGKTTGPPLLRGMSWALRAVGRFLRELGRMLAWYGRGIGVLLVLVAGWLSGKYGKRGSIGARFAGVAFLVYAAVKLSQKYEFAWLVAVLALIVTAALAATGHIEIPVSKPAKKGDEKKKTAEEGGAKKGGKKKKAATPEEEDGPEEIPEVSKEAAPEAPRKTFLARFLSRRTAPAEDPPTDPEEADEEGPDEDLEEDDETPEEEAEETPQEDPLTALLRASIGEDNGVHLGVLRPLMRKALPGLSQATDKELRQHLISAGYDPSRTFRARGVAGRAGVHRSELPPLPSPGGAPGALSGPLSGGGERPGPAEISGSGERRRAAGEPSERWTAEEEAQGYRWVQDPSKPCAWKLEKLDDQ